MKARRSAGPRVDRLVESADEFEVVAFLFLDELIEDEVPDLEETIARDVDDRATIRAVRRTAVVADFCSTRRWVPAAPSTRDLPAGRRWTRSGSTLIVFVQ